MRLARRSSLGLFFVLAYVVFWALLGITGGIMALRPPSWVLTVMQNVCAWSPTFVLLLLFKRIYPNVSFRRYLRAQFLTKVNPVVFPLLLLLQGMIVLLAAGAHSLITLGSLSGIGFAGFAGLPSALLVNATSGPSGEELGWRGYALNRLQFTRSPFVSALIVGLVWGFWHTPLWFLSGFAGTRLVVYIVFFMIGILSISVVMTVFYNRHRNILVPMWIHLLFNLIMQLFAVDMIPLLAYTSLGYLILAIVLTLIYRDMLFHIAPRPNEDNTLLSVTTQ